MSWSDIFFPDNPKRREELIRKNQQLINLMEDNFTATNKLIKVVNEHLKLSIQPVTLNEKDNVKNNCNVLIQRISEIQMAVEKVDEELKESLEPDIYKKLRDMSLDLPLDKLFSKMVGQSVIGVSLALTAAVTFTLVAKGVIFAQVRATLGLLGFSIIGGLAIGLVFMGIDMIFSAIVGSFERDELESALKEYDRALADFKPASKEYQDSITEVRILMKRLKKQM